MNEKICSKCRVSKPTTEFLPRSNRPAGQTYPSCKACKAEHTRRRYRERRSEADPQYWGLLISRSIRKRAEAKGIEFALSVDDIVARVIETRGRCAYCTKQLDFYAGYERRASAASIDRIDSKVGYTRQNIVVCCYRCNAIKNDASPTELRMIADAVERLAVVRDSTGCFTP